MNFLPKQYDDQLRRIDSITTVTNNLRKNKTKEILLLTFHNDARIKGLKWAVENINQYERRKNIAIYGIVPNVHKDLPTILKNIATRLDLPFPEPDEVEAIHGLRARDDKNASMIVRFNDRSEGDR